MVRLHLFPCDFCSLIYARCNDVFERRRRNYLFRLLLDILHNGIQGMAEITSYDYCSSYISQCLRRPF